MTTKITLDQLLHELLTTDEQIEDMIKTFSDLSSPEAKKLHIFCGATPKIKLSFAILMENIFRWKDHKEMCNDCAFSDKALNDPMNKWRYTYKDFTKFDNVVVVMWPNFEEREVFNNDPVTFMNCINYMKDGHIIPICISQELPKFYQVEEHKQYCKVWNFSTPKSVEDIPFGFKGDFK